MASSKGWSTRPLKDCAVWYSGGTPNKSTPRYWGGTIPWISAKSITGFFIADSEDRVTDEGARNGTRLMPTNTILFIVRGMSLKSEFRMGITTRPVTFNQDLKALVAVEDVVPAFLAYAIKARTDEILGLVGEAGHGTGVLPTDRIQSLEIPIPPLPEQRAIAHILGSLDDKIELNRRMNETLEAMARALFKSWFVDFDPVRAKAEGRQPSGMDAETAKLFPSEFEDSGLGEVPKGWTCSPLGDWASALSGGTPSKSNPSLWGGDLPWVSPKVMTSMHADEADDFVTASAVGNGTRIAPLGSTLVMVRGMGLHQEVRVSQARREVTFNQDVKALVPKAIEASLLLFALLNGQEELLGRVESSGHGTGKLPSEILLGHRITLPPISRQKPLAQTFDALNDRIGAARQEARTLAKTRDTLLPQLLSGELDISTIECFAGAVA